MKKLIMTGIIVISLVNGLNAQLTKTWKNQIYGGYSKSRQTNSTPVSDNVDLNYVSKYNWLFNAGWTHADYKFRTTMGAAQGIPLTSWPKVYVDQFNLSVGRRIDLTPKWSISLFSGISYTRCSFPDTIITLTQKKGIIFPMSFSGTMAHYDTKHSIGLHLNGEINFFLCENLSIHVGYMHDFNSAHKTGGLLFGGRVGLMKQKYGTRRMSRIKI